MASKTTGLEEKIKEAWLEWKNNPTKENTQKLVEAAKPILDRVITGYFGQSYLGDRLLRGKAELHLIKSLQNYDITKGNIVNYIWINMQRLQRYLGQQQSTLRLSERNIMLISEMNKTEKRLEEELGRPPTIEELADAMKQSPEKLAKLKAYRSLGYESTFEAGVDESGGWLPAVKKDERSLSNEFLDVIYDYLSDPKEKLVMEYIYGIKGRPKMSVTETAKKINMSPAYVSRVVKKIEEHYQKMSDYWRRIGTPGSESLESMVA
ncbi:MAG: sigma-70 domain-containing protein [Nitrososphaerota archaeon]